MQQPTDYIDYVTHFAHDAAAANAHGDPVSNSVRRTTALSLLATAITELRCGGADSRGIVYVGAAMAFVREDLADAGETLRPEHAPPAEGFAYADLVRGQFLGMRADKKWEDAPSTAAGSLLSDAQHVLGLEGGLFNGGTEAQRRLSNANVHINAAKVLIFDVVHEIREELRQQPESALPQAM
jgi:hypothetical protein